MTMTSFWALAVARDDLSRTALVEGDVPEIGDGEALLRVDRVGLTANNVTYAVLGESFRYWDFFPAEPGWGMVPLWGFADIAASAVAGVPVGGRVYGYLPPASHLVVRPGRADARGFRDASPHRAPLPSPYNAYALTTGDAAYRAVSRPPPTAGSTWSATTATTRCARYGSTSWPAAAPPAPATC
jgi:Protein of unknown function (DUF2855)